MVLACVMVLARFMVLFVVMVLASIMDLPHAMVLTALRCYLLKKDLVFNSPCNGVSCVMVLSVNPHYGFSPCYRDAKSNLNSTDTNLAPKI